jgi:hypothetical protein
MPRYGFELMTELHRPAALLDQAPQAEDAGFDFLGIALLPAGDDTKGFIRFWTEEVRPLLP